MGSISLVCPMCCGETFNDSESLKYHLLSMTDNLYCPGCSLRTYSMAALIQHLDTCGKKQLQSQEEESNSNGSEDNQDDNGAQNILIHDVTNDAINGSFLATVNEEGIMVVEGRTIQVDENGDIQVVDKVISKKVNINKNTGKKGKRKQIFESTNESQVDDLMNQSKSQLLNKSENTLLSMTEDEVEYKENSDMIDIKAEFIQAQQEEEPPKFICNTCGMSFNNAEDHMDKYHGGQKYEEVLPEQQEGELIVPSLKEEVAPAKSVVKSTSIATSRPTRAAKRKLHQKQPLNTLKTEECVDSDGRLYTRKVVKIERFWDRTPITLSTTKAPMIEKFFSNVEGVKVKDASQTITVAPKKVYRCNQCLDQFPRLSDFRAHVCPEGQNQCDHCEQAFATVKALQKHMKTHAIAGLMPISQTIFECDVCGTEFATHKSLRLHSRMHQPVKSRHVDAPEGTDEDTFKCEECGTTLSESYRAAHMSLHEGNTATCTVCNRKFDSAESLAMHTAVHVETASAQAAATAAVAAELLNAATQNSIDPILANAGVSGPLVSGATVAAAVEAAAAAEDVEASKEKPYSCQHCGRRFSRPHEKVKHERIHTGEKPHVCEVCGKTFRVSYCLTLHMRTHTGVRPYECRFCGKRFKASSVYNHHLLTHGDERAYTCPYCPKTFKTRVQLAGHKNSHTKPFRCTECSRPFASLYAARSHMETHKKENNLKFSCEICGASYGRAFAVKDHMKTAHGLGVTEMPPEAAREEEVHIDENFLLRDDNTGVEADELIVPESIACDPDDIDLGAED